MPHRALPIVLWGTLVLGGCNSFAYVSRTYVALTPQVVTIGCSEPYEIYDNRQKRKMLVVSNAVRELTGCDISGARTFEGPEGSRASRLRTAARTYLDETAREDCALTGETVFADLQTEFGYSCSTLIESRSAKVPRLPGRGRDAHHH